MKLLEYESKTLLANSHIPIPRGALVSDASNLNLPVVLKSQVPTGGRGKVGGIVIVEEKGQLQPIINKILNLEICGFKPKTILAEEKLSIKKELYLSILVDRQSASIKLIAHKNGGVEVEDNTGFKSWEADDTPEVVGQQLADYYELPGQTFALQDLIENLKTCFIKNDATLIEINPLILTADDQLIAGDCKMTLDDAASFRHDWNFEERPAEANFVTIDPKGNTATIANGAGLAMATVDAAYEAGLKPANFLDIGGGANEAMLLKAFNRIVEYKNLKAIIINIFAGITRADEVAKAIVSAKKQIENLPPLFIRLAGTNYQAASKILAKEHIVMMPNLESCLIAAKETINSTSYLSTFYRHDSAPVNFVYRHFIDIADTKLPQASNTSIASLFTAKNVIVQGITGIHGSFQTKAMLAAGTHIIAGTTPGKAGQEVEGVKVYDAITDIQQSQTIDISVIFVPAPHAKGAILEAITAHVPLIICITEGIPVHDMLAVNKALKGSRSTLLGPNSPGALLPGINKLGIIPASLSLEGTAAIVSRSGTLTYETMAGLTDKGIGQKYVIGIGGDIVHGMGYKDCLELFENDPDVDKIILIGEIGGQDEIEAATYIKEHVTKPVFAYIAGHHAPAGVQLGHAGAILGSDQESAGTKTKILAEVGAITAQSINELLNKIT